MSRKQLAIIGNGMATSRLLDGLLRLQAHRTYEISVFGEENQGSYNRILLNQVLLGGDVDEITFKPRSWYAKQGIRLISGQKVTRLSAAAHRLWTEDGTEHYFDKAVFATGSAPRLPIAEGLLNRQGVWKRGIAAYRTIDDCQKIRKLARPGGNAVVIGGGLLGIEAAKGLLDLGMNVTIVHLFSHLMNRQLDPLGATFLRQSLAKMGIAVITSVNTKGFEGIDRVEALRLADGSRLPADLVILASGVKPRIDLARDSNIPTNAGIHVNDELQTSIPDIYAVGECAEHRYQTYGTVQPVYEQCSVLAEVLAGSQVARYGGSKVYTRLKVVGIDVASMGDIEGRAGEDEVIQIIEESKGVYRKLVIREGRLAGAVLVGDTHLAGELVGRFERGDLLPANRLDLFASADLSPQAQDPLVCHCRQVTKSTILAACDEGCRNLNEIGERTGAGTGCGSCRGPITAMLLNIKKQQPVAL